MSARPSSTAPRARAYQRDAAAFITQHLPDLSASALAEGTEMAEICHRQPRTRWPAVVDSVCLDTFERVLGRRGLGDIVTGRPDLARLDEGQDLGAVLAQTSRALRVTVTAMVLILWRRGQTCTPAVDVSLAPMCLLTLAPATTREATRAWLAGLTVSGLRAALEPTPGLALAVLATRFESPFDADDVLPRIAARLPAQVRRAA